MKNVYSIHVFILLSLFVNIGMVLAQDPSPEELSMPLESQRIPGTIEGTGTHFEITDSEYLNIIIDSVEEISLTLESVPEMVIMYVEPVSGVTSSAINLTGFLPLTIYYKYEDNYHNGVAFTTNGGGSYSYVQDISTPHLVFIQSRPGTRFIPSDLTIGTWDPVARIYKLTTDVYETIQVDEDNLILDGNGHMVLGTRSGFGILIHNRTGVTVKKLNIQSFLYGVALGFSSNSMVSGNFISGSCSYGIYLNNSSGNTLTNNIALGNQHHGIYFYSSRGNILTGNTTSGNQHYGIYFTANSSGNNLTDNIASGNQHHGIYLEDSRNNGLIGNIASENQGFYGIGLAGASDNMLIGNIVSGSGQWHGIALGMSSNNTLTGNITSGSWYGIGLYNHSNNNTLTGNTVSDSQVYGIYLANSSGNQIYNNNFIDNARQAYDVVGGNAFSLAPPIGGNYWSDWTTPDADSDGFVDFPYVFPGGQDELPWAFQNGWENQPPVADANGPYVGAEGFAIALDASGSSDPDGGIVSYQWDLDGDGKYDDATGSMPSYTWQDDHSGNIGLKVIDDGGLTAIDTATVVVNNVAPSIDTLAGSTDPVAVGTVIAISIEFTDPGEDTWTGEVYYGDGSGEQELPITDRIFVLSHVYADNGTYTVAVMVRDDNGGEGTGTATVTVVNVDPVVDAGPDIIIDEGSTFTNSGSFSDPGIGTWTATVDYGDGSGEQELPLTGKAFLLSHVYIDNGIYTVTVKVRDDDGGEGTDTATVTVTNVDPAVSAVDNQNVDEGTPLNVVAAFSDAGIADTHTAMVEWGDETTSSGDISESEGQGTASGSHAYCDNKDDGYSALLTVKDKDGGTENAGFVVTVRNVPPSIGSITAPSDPAIVGTEIAANADFTDPGKCDTHTATWNWGDGCTTAGTVSEADGSGTVSGNHIYTIAGVYTLTLTVTDKDEDSDDCVFCYVVIYNPEAGFVTGAGWINSPVGAYVPDSSLTGKANFGFISKYQKGASVPTGQTQFKFHVAGMHFNSTEYQWLVVAGAKAQFKGSGTINHSGDYGFMLSSIDGQLTGGVDTFRIKIWARDTGSITYDNQLNAEENADPTTAIGGGNIIIHNDASAAPPLRPLLLSPEHTRILPAFPIPSNPDVWIPYQLGSDSKVVIRIHDASGRVIRTLDLGHQPAGYYVSKDKAAHWDGSNEAGELVASGVHFCTIEAGGYRATKKLVIIR